MNYQNIPALSVFTALICISWSRARMSPMKVVRFLLIAIATLVLVVGVGFGIAWIHTTPTEMPAGSDSASRLETGPHPVGHTRYDLSGTYIRGRLQHAY